MLEVGTKAPEFTLTDKDGNQVSLKDLAGKRIFTAEIGHIIYNICNKKPQHY